MKLHICEATQSSSIHNVCPSLRGALATVLARENFLYTLKKNILDLCHHLWVFFAWQAYGGPV